jgi:hypothetical protein
MVVLAHSGEPITFGATSTDRPSAASLVLQRIVILIPPKHFFFIPIKIYYSSSSRINQVTPPLLSRHVKINCMFVTVILTLLGLIQGCDNRMGPSSCSCQRNTTMGVKDVVKNFTEDFTEIKKMFYWSCLPSAIKVNFFCCNTLQSCPFHVLCLLSHVL